jgi:hypothetical protein
LLYVLPPANQPCAEPDEYTALVLACQRTFQVALPLVQQALIEIDVKHRDLRY